MDSSTSKVTNQPMIKAYLLTEVLRATGEREFPLQLASTFFWIAAHDGCRQEDLVNATSMSSSSVSRNVSWLGPRHRLGKDGLKLVIREKDPRDPKRYRLFLTPKGKQLSSLIQNTLDKWYSQFEKINPEELKEDVLQPLKEDLNTPEYIAKLHSLFDEAAKGNKSSRVKFLSACHQIGLLEESKELWENFKKSKVKIDENFINKKIEDRNEARKKGNYKLADSLRKELESKGVIIKDEQNKTIWKYK